VNRHGVTAHPLTADHRRMLLDTAADTIGRGLTTGERTLPATATATDPANGTADATDPANATADTDVALTQAAATFVSLERGAALLGCIGTLEPIEGLATNVARNAWNAAFADPRLPSVTPADHAAMTIKISVLSRLSPMRARSWRDVQRAVRPGVDGVLVEAGPYRATLLPSVWEKLDDPATFLDVLWHKAGLRPRDWLPGTQVRRYTTDEFADAGPRDLVRG